MTPEKLVEWLADIEQYFTVIGKLHPRDAEAHPSARSNGSMRMRCEGIGGSMMN